MEDVEEKLNKFVYIECKDKMPFVDGGQLRMWWPKEERSDQKQVPKDSGG